MPTIGGMMLGPMHGLLLACLSPALVVAADGLNLRISFQPAQTPVEPGWLADQGEAFTAHGAQAYGWNGDNRTAYQRSQPTSPDLAHDTVIHLQRPENPDARWRLALPNGIYRVRVVCGDPTYANSVFRVAVQDVVAVDGVPDGDHRWIEGIVVVQVEDGMLAVTNVPGASNNKLCFIEVTSVASDG